MPDSETCDLGVDNTGGYDGVTITGGSLREFATGIFAFEAERSRISRVASTDNLFGGFVVTASPDSQIDRNEVARNGLETDIAALIVVESAGLRIERNSVSGNGDIGIFAPDVEDSRITRNDLTDNPEAGMILEGSGNEISRNRVRHNGDGLVVFGPGNRIVDNDITDATGCEEGCGFGISLEGGAGNLIAGNAVRQTLRDGIRLASFDPETPTEGTVVRDNRVRDAGVDGFSVGTEGEGTVSGTLLERNSAIGSGDDGFDIRSPATVLARNLAVHSGDLGIDAVPGVTDAGGNKAHANGDGSQCSGVACR